MLLLDCTKPIKCLWLIIFSLFFPSYGEGGDLMAVSPNFCFLYPVILVLLFPFCYNLSLMTLLHKQEERETINSIFLHSQIL